MLISRACQMTKRRYVSHPAPVRAWGIYFGTSEISMLATSQSCSLFISNATIEHVKRSRNNQL